MQMCCVAMAKACRADMHTTCESTQARTHTQQPAHLGTQAHDGTTALLMAAREGHEEVVKLLLGLIGDGSMYVSFSIARGTWRLAFVLMMEGSCD